MQEAVSFRKRPKLWCTTAEVLVAELGCCSAGKGVVELSCSFALYCALLCTAHCFVVQSLLEIGEEETYDYTQQSCLRVLQGVE